MTIFYSNTTKGFYDSDFHGEDIPEDGVEITKDEHAALLQGQSEGKVIKGFPKRKPTLIENPGPTPEEQTALDNKSVLDQIKAIETDLQPRAIRDMVLRADRTRLDALEVQIAALRAQLK